MSYFSHRGDSGGGSGEGEGYLELTVASLSSLGYRVGSGWGGTMRGFAFNVFFTKVIVLFLYCCVGKVYAYFQ